MFVGVDGCRAGWFAVKLTDGFKWDLGVFEDIKTLWTNLHYSAVILIDIPIGLRDSGTDERECDIEARKILGNKRAPSVFRAPSRKAVYSPKGKASDTNYDLTKKRLPLQTLNILPKIKEVDALLSKDKSVRLVIKEIHPEICFWALSGHHSMPYSKKKKEGFFERKRILQSIYAETENIVDKALTVYRRRNVARDDILDALAAAVTAKMGFGRFLTLPEKPPVDSKGLHMEMVYYVPVLVSQACGWDVHLRSEVSRRMSSIKSCHVKKYSM